MRNHLEAASTTKFEDAGPTKRQMKRNEVYRADPKQLQCSKLPLEFKKRWE